MILRLFQVFPKLTYSLVMTGLLSMVMAVILGVAAMLSPRILEALAGVLDLVALARVLTVAGVVAQVALARVLTSSGWSSDFCGAGSSFDSGGLNGGSSIGGSSGWEFYWWQLGMCWW